MKSHALCTLVVLTSGFLLGCSPSEYAVNPTGDIVTVTTREKAEITGELLAVQDSAILVSTRSDAVIKQLKPEGTILRINTSDLSKVVVNGYSDRSWLKYVLIFEGVPTVLLTIAAASYSEDGHSAEAGPWFLAGALLTGLNYLVFELSTPSPPRAEKPITADKLNDLRKYARFPLDSMYSPIDSLLEIHQFTEPGSR
jgi:hypothetical protein